MPASRSQQENAEPAQADAGSAGRLKWTVDHDDGYLARALAEDIAYTVVRVTFADVSISRHASSPTPSTSISPCP
jgi:hypothetical protein